MVNREVTVAANEYDAKIDKINNNTGTKKFLSNTGNVYNLEEIDMSSKIDKIINNSGYK